MMASPSIGRCGSSRPTLRALIPTAACALTPRPTPPRRPCMARGCCSAAARWCRPISRPVGSCGPSSSSSRRARTTTSSTWPEPCASAKSAPSATGCSRNATWTASRAKGGCMQGLAALPGGAVVHDGYAKLSAARSALAYFPDDVLLYKIASQWQRIGNEQAFVGRAGQVGDDLGTRGIAARLMRDVMRMAFLLERRHAPYAKWFGSAFARLPIASELTPHLDRALTAHAWRERGEALAAAYLVLAQRQQADGLLGDVEPVIGPYFDRPFTTINADALGAAVRAKIVDPQLRALPPVGG